MPRAARAGLAVPDVGRVHPGARWRRQRRRGTLEESVSREQSGGAVCCHRSGGGGPRRARAVDAEARGAHGCRGALPAGGGATGGRGASWGAATHTLLSPSSSPWSRPSRTPSRCSCWRPAPTSTARAWSRPRPCSAGSSSSTRRITTPTPVWAARCSGAPGTARRCATCAWPRHWTASPGTRRRSPGPRPACRSRAPREEGVSTPAAVAYAVAAGAYAGFQLTVRFVVYPQFARVPQDAFAADGRAHQRLITPLVGFLFGAMALTAAACVLAGPRGTGLVAAGLF